MQGTEYFEVIDLFVEVKGTDRVKRCWQTLKDKLAQQPIKKQGRSLEIGDSDKGWRRFMCSLCFISTFYISMGVVGFSFLVSKQPMLIVENIVCFAASYTLIYIGILAIVSNTGATTQKNKESVGAVSITEFKSESTKNYSNQ